MDADITAWIADEEALLARMGAALAAIGAEDAAREAAMLAEGQRLTAERATIRGDKLQLEVLDQALADVGQRLDAHRAANRVRDLSSDSPYFAHLRLSEGGRARDVLLGKGSAVDARLPANVVDWRDAPISRLYYEYEEGEEFCEEIAGREREGTVIVRRRVDIRGGVLQEIGCRNVVVRRRPEGWVVAATGPGEAAERPEREDHRLPDIVSLITRDQFEILTRPDAGVVLLRGQAGSGKTTVALHRIAYLRYRDPKRFDPRRALVVMFNKALQSYVSRSLDDLDLRGVRVETFHGWAARHLAGGGPTLRFIGGTPPDVARIKRHVAMEALLRAYVDRLGRRSVDWFTPPAHLAAAWEATPGDGLARLHAFFRRNRLVGEDAARRDQLLARLADHARDLRATFDDEALCDEVLPPDLAGALRDARPRMVARRPNGFDFEDAALLLRLGQLKHDAMPALPCPWRRQFSHVVIDEAQDLSIPEIAALIEAADDERSVTIAGDPAQTLYASAPVDFEALLASLTGGGASRLDTLPVGHRSSAPILELALRALGRADPGLLAKTRGGAPVRWLDGADAEPSALIEELRSYRAQRRTALVAVLCKTKRDADRWFSLLHPDVPAVRRVDRDGLLFEPGVVVTNVHQVKGLEFDGVVVVDPAAYGEGDRRLLHVAITRAADRLWVVAPGGRGLLG